MSVIEVLREFQGIIGTLLGVATTLFITKWLESWGKIRYYFDNVNINYYRLEFGEHVKSEIVEKAEYVSGEFDFEVYNGSNIVKPIKNIKILIITENNNIETDLLDADTYRAKAARAVYDNLSYINLRPKEVQVYRLRFHLLNSDFIDGKVENIKEVCFIAKDIKNRTIKRVVYKE